MQSCDFNKKIARPKAMVKTKNGLKVFDTFLSLGIPHT